LIVLLSCVSKQLQQLLQGMPCRVLLPLIMCCWRRDRPCFCSAFSLFKWDSVFPCNKSDVMNM
jgi:hypothetical protein